MKMKITSSDVKKYSLLYFNLLLYSLFLVLARFAGSYPLVSRSAILIYFACFFVLGMYAILWQQVLKRFPLMVAYANRAIIIPLSMLWGVLLFNERITWNMVLGAAIIIGGIMLVVRSDE